MADQDVLRHINELVEEEHALFHKAEHGGLDAEGHQRLQSLQVSLDQCWDLLRQRRGRRDAGKDPEGAHVRDAAVVERYTQ